MSEVWPAMEALLPISKFVFGRRTKPASKCLYRTLGSKPAITQYKDTNGDVLIEDRAAGYDVLPGSEHASGERIEWFSSPAEWPPNDVDDAGLREAVRLCAVVATSKGERSEDGGTLGIW